MARKTHIYNGIVFAEHGTGVKVLGYVNMRDDRTRLSIPNVIIIVDNGCFRRLEVTDIAKCAFENNLYIQHLELPKSLRYIEAGAFRNCVGLQTVIPTFDTPATNGITIAKGAFSYCTNLLMVHLNRPVTWLMQEAFAKCPKLTQFKGAIFDIAKDAFGPCKLERLTFLPNCRIHAGSIEHSNVQQLLFEGELEYAPKSTMRWLKKSNVKICCSSDSKLQHLAYEGVPVEVMLPF